MANSAYSKVIDCPYCEHSDDTDFIEDIGYMIYISKSSSGNTFVECKSCGNNFLVSFEIDLHVKITKIGGEDK